MLKIGMGGGGGPFLGVRFVQPLVHWENSLKKSAPHQPLIAWPPRFGGGWRDTRLCTEYTTTRHKGSVVRIQLGYEIFCMSTPGSYSTLNGRTQFRIPDYRPICAAVLRKD